MLIEIKEGDYLPLGLYALNDLSKIDRAIKSLPANANERSILLEYDKIGGLIHDTKNSQKMPVHTFWNIEKVKMNDSVEHLSDAELLSIIRKAENTNTAGSRYQRANIEWQIRHQQKLIDATKNGRSGISFEVGGNMVNDGTILTDPTASVDIAVAGNYSSKKGKIIQGKSGLKEWYEKPLGILALSIIAGVIVGGILFWLHWI